MVSRFCNQCGKPIIYCPIEGWCKCGYINVSYENFEFVITETYFDVKWREVCE